ncbi:tryptophan synthase subunit alpha [Natribacillus halophilus]|uniref:Tryptophan synthase alpha chain n=1 Tax=Natribacillus halophilus TaxID=549003 RepID=A0A1G8JBD0_9BACI|nr:tryptophan synthase subunit alpha [Natribacillus halophilus]SDI28578.1 tryptophan synthase, alpha chain [Natribacillus halophilus]
MNSVEQAARAAEDQLFIPYMMAGDPSFDASVEIALQLEAAGAHILELGVPYTDPLADGPVIQEASHRALDEGMTLTQTFSLVVAMRERGVTIPIVLFCYVNPLLRFGIDAGAEAAARAGADGWLIPDLPFEENEDVRASCRRNDLALVSLVAPTSEKRIQSIASQAEGFLYCVSSLGVTGVRNAFAEGIDSFLQEARAYSQVPLAIGFGVSSSQQVEAIQARGYGAIVGSAIVREIGKRKEALRHEHSRPQALEDIKSFVETLVSS